MNKVNIAGKKVRIIATYSNYIGQIGTITSNNYSYEKAWNVIMKDGKWLAPYSHNATSHEVECELLEEYDIKDITGKKFAIHCPTEEIWNKVTEINYKSGLFPNDSYPVWYRNVFNGYKDICICTREKHQCYSPISFYKKEGGYTIIKGEDFVIHNEKLLTKQQEKVKEMKEPGLFVIKGKPHHIDAMEKDLIEMGYEFHLQSRDYGNGCIGYVKGHPENKRDFSTLYISEKDNLYGSEKFKFNLPEDYSKALEYAKEAINSPYWNQNSSRKINIGSKNTEIEIFKDKVLAENGKGQINIELLKRRYKNLLALSGSTNDIGDYGMFILNDIRFIRIGCMSENNLVSMQEIKKVLDIVDELNK